MMLLSLMLNRSTTATRNPAIVNFRFLKKQKIPVLTTECKKVPNFNAKSYWMLLDSRRVRSTWLRG